MMKSLSIPTMTQLAFWAKKHPGTTRWVIAFGRLIMGYNAFYWGAVLADFDMDIANTAWSVSAFVYVVGFIFYPRKKDRENRHFNLARQKICDVFLVISSCVFWLAAGNYVVHWQPEINTETSQAEVLQSAIIRSNPKVIYPFEHSKIVKKAKQKREGIFKKIKNWKEGFFKKFKARVMLKLAMIKSAYRELSSGQIALLILASLAIMIGLGSLVAVYSCSLSCNGQEGAASAVLFFGCFLIIGLVALIWTSAVKNNKFENNEPSRKKPLPGVPNAALSMPASEPVPLEVINPNIQVCFETDDPKGVDGVTVSFNGNVLMENIQLGEVPLCVEVSAQPEMVNRLEVTSADGQVNMSIEDGKFLKRMILTNHNGQPSGFDLILKK